METNNSKGYLIPLGFAITLALGLWIGNSLNSAKQEIALTPGETNYSKVRDIIDILNKKYVDSLNSQEVFESAISDMLHKLDPHSNYIPASELKAVNEMIEGHFGGIGVRFAIIRDSLCVTNVLPNSPSAAADLKAGDRIIQIEKTVLTKKNISNERVMKMLKGLENTKVNLVILRQKKKIKKVIVRGTIPINTVSAAYMMNSEVAYLKLDQFSIESGKEFLQAAQKLKAQGMKKMIFDLRSNGGGVLQSAIEIVDQFLGAGKKIVETKGQHSPDKIYRATARGILEQTEVVVLINSGSASASEIVAGALQDNDRAIILGRRSFGKGLVQEDIRLKDGSNLRLTVARYYTPTGRCIQKPYSDGDYESYMNDAYDRFENGELYAIDSTLLVDSLKKVTPKGKVVYGGGGILPDVFIPIDTIGSSWYYSALRYSPAFQNFAFDFVANKRFSWRSAAEFKNGFQLSDELMDQFLSYAAKNQKIARDKFISPATKKLIKTSLKAEIARQLWTELGYFTVINDADVEVQRAFKLLQSK